MKVKENTFREVLLISRKQNLTLRQRMMIYLVFMILASIVLVTILSIVGGIVWSDEIKLTQVLENHLDRMEQKMGNEMDSYVGYTFNLSKQLSRTIECQLENENYDVSAINDSSDKLVELQRRTYGDLNTALLMGGCNGVYAVIDATVNTALEGAEQSRSGLYLRLVNINSKVALVPETIMFRGSPEVAWEKGLELHNRWNLEFDTSVLPAFREIMDGNYSASEGFWTNRMQLKDTWENVILLCVPIQGSTGKIYGICGMELNAIHFSTEYAVKESGFGSIVTVLAPMEDGKLRLDLGMIGSTQGTWLTGSEVLERQAGKKLQIYQSEHGTFFGVQKKMNVHGLDGKKWVAAVLVSKDTSMNYIRKNLFFRIITVIAYGACMILLALYLSRRFVQPILKSFDDIKEDRGEGTADVRIAELEELREFIKSKNQKLKIKELPENIEEMLLSFQKRTKTLTPAEKTLLKYYSLDYSLEEIADFMFISIGTAKKHNTNMNRKLEISSRSQLMVYIELFRRCNRLQDILSD